jgi:hypothetical protein
LAIAYYKSPTPRGGIDRAVGNYTQAIKHDPKDAADNNRGLALESVINFGTMNQPWVSRSA